MAGGVFKADRAAIAASEFARVTALLRRDRKALEAETRRREAIVRVENGDFTSLDDTVLGPTPEQLERFEYRPFTADKIDGTVRPVKTVRRVTELRIIQLHNCGVLDDDSFSAARWYRSRWERSGLDGGASIAAYGSDPKGEKMFGVMPRTECQAEARADFRFARAGIPDDLAPLFDRVTLHEETLAEAARSTRLRYANAKAAFRLAAWRLHGRIAHLLPAR